MSNLPGSGYNDVPGTFSTTYLPGVIRETAYACSATGHDFRQGADAPTGHLYSNLLYCSKCGDVRELKLEETE